LQKPAQIAGHWLPRLMALRLMALTGLFALLSYMGSALYHHAGGLTTVKPFGGIALALLLIYGRSWVLPVLVSGTLGGIFAKIAFAATLSDTLLTPVLGSAMLLATYFLSLRFIAPTIDFRAWKQLLGFIAIAAGISAVTATLFAAQLNLLAGYAFVTTWRAWFVPTTLSYVIFTPVVVLLATAERDAIRNNARRIAASLGMLAVILACNYLPTPLPVFFVIPMALLVVTMISGIEGVALGVVLMQFVLTASVALGHGPLAVAHLPLGYQLHFMQVFIGAMIVVTLPAAAAITERNRLRAAVEAALKREEQVNRALRESEKRYREMAERAERASAAKSEFLASMSHELRTPLNAILGFTEIFRVQLFGPLGHPKYLEYATDVHKSGAHLLDLINDVLDLSKIDAGKMELRETTFVLGELINDAVLLIRDRAKGHVALDVETVGGFRILADKRLTKQILINLLSNAIKFTPAGGTVSVSAQTNSAGALEICVTDTGVGMNAAQLEQAFSPYGQVDSKITQIHQGTGLGLPIAQSLAKLHGGDLIAQSAPGEGTRMILIFPQNRVVEGVTILPAGEKRYAAEGYG
jgi:two-component system cell cycle sensor histidine kinase PleC